MKTSQQRSTGRTVLLAAALAASTLTLSACFGAPSDSDKPATSAVDFEQVESATIQIEAVGSFIDPEGSYEVSGRGSGFIVTPDGLAVTNNHVVVGAGTLKVWLEGKTYNAKILGSSECLDLAVIQLEKGTYPYFDWHKGDITTAMEVYAAGFPLGDPTFTMTKGIVSKSSTRGETQWASLSSVIEHDARTQHGSSGGPLIDAKGRLVGVNYAGIDSLDINLSIHRDEVLDVLPDLEKGQDVLSLGINGRAITDDEGTGLGVWVSSVAAGSTADKAGVEAGDLVTRLGGVSLAKQGTMTGYCDVRRTQGQDATIDVELYRPTEGAYYRGQMSGEKLEPVKVVGGDSPTAEFVTVNDDLGILGVEIPSTWNQINGAPFSNDLGTWASIIASSNLDAFNSSWDAPGVNLAASADAVGLMPASDLIASAAQSLVQGGCVSQGRQPYDDSYHVGEFEIFQNCGGTGASYVLVAAQAVDNSYMVLVGVQANTEADLNAVDRVLGSFIAAF
mgnify:CR=1 FL=1